VSLNLDAIQGKLLFKTRGGRLSLQVEISGRRSHASNGKEWNLDAAARTVRLGMDRPLLWLRRSGSGLEARRA
jgi:hypothetical protein